MIEKRVIDKINQVDDEDDEILVQGQIVSLKCPMSQQLLVQAVENQSCGHVFSKESIEAHFTQSGSNHTSCPMTG